MSTLERKHEGIDWVNGYTCIAKSTIRRWAESGVIPARKVGGRWRFETDRIKRWFDGKSNEAGV